MSEISKGKVLEVFMRHYGSLAHLPKQKRLIEADGATVDELSPWREGMSPEEEARAKWVVVCINEILQDDFGVPVVQGRKYTPRETEGCAAGGQASIAWLRDHADQVPKGPITPEWMKEVRAIGFNLVPRDRAGDSEWTYGFIAAFTGDLFRHLQGKPPIDSPEKKEGS